MNTVWSEQIQSIGTLYSSRALRFAAPFRERYQSLFALPENASILEIGCGPGALAEALARWYPAAQITGLDRDSAFIEFAAHRMPQLRFTEGDAAALPFADGSFDVTISHTVAEHIDPAVFYREQRRVLKEGGICLVLSVRRGIHVLAPCIEEESDFEKEIWQRTADCYTQRMKQNHVCAFPQDEAELVRNMERAGFHSVTTGYVVSDLTPDDPKFSREMARAMIEAERTNDLDGAELLPRIAPGIVTQEELERLCALIREKYERRLALLRDGVRQWDTVVSVTQVVRGVR